jgi:uncharacterized membrane protein
VPDASLTEIWDINSSNVMVGAVSVAAGGTSGIIHQNGRWTVILPPGAGSSVAFGINEQGQIVGGFTDENGAQSTKGVHRQQEGTGVIRRSSP